MPSFASVSLRKTVASMVVTFVFLSLIVLSVSWSLNLTSLSSTPLEVTGNPGFARALPETLPLPVLVLRLTRVWE